MATAVEPHFLTADEFLVHPAARERSELVGGEIRLMSPASGRHHVVIHNLYLPLGMYVEAHGLGQCFPDGAGFDLTDRLPPRPGSTVRSPDTAFVRAARVPPGGFPDGFIRLAPDLAVEVLSPSESASTLSEKVADYLEAGTPLLWVIDPRTRLVTVTAADAPAQVLRETDTLDGGSVLPGFAIPLADLFKNVARG